MIVQLGKRVCAAAECVNSLAEKRPQAQYCSGACRARAARERASRRGRPVEPHRKRTRTVRRGVSIYLPNVDTARAVRHHLRTIRIDSPALTAAGDAIDRAITRAEERRHAQH